MKFLLIGCGLLLALAGCTLPQGAPLQSTVLESARSPDSPFETIAVTRDIANELAQADKAQTWHWPRANNGADATPIRSGDRLTVTIWDSAENSLLAGAEQKTVTLPDLRVASDGTIYVPFAGPVDVAGLTPREARARLQERLTRVATNPQVLLTLIQGQKNTVDLVSGVRAPGQFPLPSRNYTILSLISAGGGLLPEHRNPRIKLIRNRQKYAISAEALFQSGSRNIPLNPGDKVIVEDDPRSFTALGATGVETLVPFPKDHLTAIEALALIGGLKDSRADAKGLLVLRDAPRPKGRGIRQTLYVLDLTTAEGLFAARNFPVRSGDTLLATESPVTRTQTVLSLFGQALGVAGQAQATP